MIFSQVCINLAQSYKGVGGRERRGGAGRGEGMGREEENPPR